MERFDGAFWWWKNLLDTSYAWEDTEEQTKNLMMNFKGIHTMAGFSCWFAIKCVNAGLQESSDFGVCVNWITV